MSYMTSVAVAWLRAGEYGTLCPICGYDAGPLVAEPDPPACPSCGSPPRREVTPWGTVRKLEQRGSWIYAEMPWRGDPLPPPLGWDPVVQFRRVQVDLGASFAAWRATLPPPMETAHLPQWMGIVEGRLALLPDPPAAIEALWDGDSSGWFVVLCAITRRPSPAHPRHTSTELAILQARIGDWEPFTRRGPSELAGPHAWLALEVGGAVARERGIPFHFASPDREDDDLPRWWDTDTGRRP